MTLEQTLQAMYDHFPALYQERADCYNQLFCTIGNGMEWENGELVDSIGNPIQPLHPLKDGKAFQYQHMSLRDQARMYLTRPSDLHSPIPKEELETYLLNFPDDKTHEKPRKDRWYFRKGGLCKDFAHLFHCPPNIKPDWKQAVQECCEMLIEDGFPSHEFQSILQL